MKLSYRGLHYAQNPVLVNSNQVKAIGKYRGANVEIHKFNNIARQQHRNLMTYRGIAHS